ncbi:MAG: zinc metallopeptidase [Chloroflexi bacterium]|nr:zinc metallopeptidase [Chloroflexota bacterium]MCI0575072.1 zinc metallopeptidase [Chloroflexota bacterium]MCI0643598.1 zinc metallopeptidase [Chloroflexota bacterium]MCI0726220.1 zinc metallopeptidase [Chloroflexota bacterium]
MFFDPLWFLFALPGLLLGLWAQARIRSAYGNYSKVRTLRGVTGAEVAQALLNSQGLANVAIEETRGLLSDHYDPRSKMLRLSSEVYRTPSVAAAGVAAHEAGHALQHAQGYAPLQFRTALVPVVQFGSTLAPWLFIAGFLLRLTPLAWFGVALFAGAVVFALVTLPVEFDASNRAKKLLGGQGILVGQEEMQGVKKVLDAAALTYVAAAVSAMGQLLYFVLLLTGGRRR